MCAIDGSTLTVADSPANMAGSASNAAAPPAALAIRSSGWWRWWPAAPARSSTRCSSRSRAARPPCPPTCCPACARACCCWPTVTSPPRTCWPPWRTGAQMLVRGKTRPPNCRCCTATRRLLPVAVRRPAGPGHRSRDHHHHHRRAPHRRLSAASPHCSTPTVPGRRAHPALPRTLGDRDRLPGAEVQHPGRPGPARPHSGRHRAGDLRPAGRPTRSCAPQWPTPPTASPTSTPTGPASPSPCTPPATSSSTPPASSPTPTSTSSAPSAPRPGQPLPARRIRVKARIVKRAISKYKARGPTIDRRSYQATISINILATRP